MDYEEYTVLTTFTLFTTSTDAPGSKVDAGWEGNIRAIKWRDQEGTAHDGCNGMTATVLSSGSTILDETLSKTKELCATIVNGGLLSRIYTSYKSSVLLILSNNYICPPTGRYVRDICIYNVEDLPWIIEKNSMFANKFESTSFPEALDCLELWHRHKVLQQALVPIQFSWYLATKVNISSATVGG